MRLVDRLGTGQARGAVTVELDDIQATVLRYRPAPCYRTHVMRYVEVRESPTREGTGRAVRGAHAKTLGLKPTAFR
jgi:hypothetical protein